MRRTLKNVVYKYTDSQIKVREATSNDPWGPPSALMSEIADLTYNVVAFTEIMQMIWKRLNDHGKNWRHVYKALVLLDYIIKTGSEKVAQQCKENIFAIQTLKDFQYVEENKDQGINVREKAKQLVGLLQDEERLKNERTKALKAKERSSQNSMGIGSTTPGSGPRSGGSSSPLSSSGYTDLGSAYTEGYTDLGTAYAEGYTDLGAAPTEAELDKARPSTAGEEEMHLQLALAMSKEEHAQEELKQHDDDVRLQLALEESRKNGDIIPNANAKTLLDLTENKDLWGSNSAPKEKMSDPWSASIPENTQIKSSADPWAASGSKIDPWSTSTIPPSKPDPWSTGQPSISGPALNAWSAQQSMNPPSPWTASPLEENINVKSDMNGFNHSENHLDDAFDFLTKRPSSTPITGQNTKTVNNYDNFNLSLMNAALLPEEPPVPARKKPEDFLGNNANLVNLENLIAKPQIPAGSTNPFTSSFTMHDENNLTSKNPFEVQRPASVPMNQMQMSAAFVPQPAPVVNHHQPIGGSHVSYQQSNNPFL